MYKKRDSGKTIGQLPKPAFHDMAVIKRQAQPNFILAHVKNDDCPFLEVGIFRKRILGLLDSGCSRTVVGSKGWDLLKSNCHLNSSIKTDCVVGNG